MRSILITFFLLFILNSGFTKNLNDVVYANEIHWYGVDFTNAKMIGSTGFTHPDIICDRYIKEKWNTYVFNEKDKYDIGKFLKGKEVVNHLDFILERNSVITTDNLIINHDHQIEQSAIKNTITSYNTNERGIGLVFIVESFNKLEESASIWVTFFDIHTNELIYTREYEVEPGGFGVLNYWLGSIYETCKQLRKDYRKWHREFS
ncbi:MAG: hypothetical protein V2I54_03975 [Bacteroidales bacterium]|jgi:hypothetical protein|nr:hypothetical protein [Bacteroidales bacterium]